jgi:hypothetical protein
MANHHEMFSLVGDSTSSVFVLEKADSVLLSIGADRSQYSVHLSPEAAQRLAWAILRGAEFINKHKQLEEV